VQNQEPIKNLEPSSLLIRSVNWLGDAVMTTPAIERLRTAFPRSRFTLLAAEKLADLWKAHPGIDSVLSFAPRESVWTVARKLRGLNFDLALILPNSPRAALESFLARIPRRVGYRASWRRALLTQAIERPRCQVQPRRRTTSEIKQLAGDPRREPAFEHQVHDYLRLAAAVGAGPSPVPPRLHVSAGEAASALAWLNDQLATIQDGARGRPAAWLAINVSAAYGPAKCWPIERFIEVVRRVCQLHPNVVCVHIGGALDRSIGEQLASAAPGKVLNLAGKTSLRQLMAVLKNCQVALSNDSGPMHVAAALGVPVVVPFGSTSPELTGPVQAGDTRQHLLRGQAGCAPCFRRTCPIDFRCMTSISVEQVTAAVTQALNPPPPA
jgi:heptosyltransferase II